MPKRLPPPKEGDVEEKDRDEDEGYAAGASSSGGGTPASQANCAPRSTPYLRRSTRRKGGMSSASIQTTCSCRISLKGGESRSR
jgi:hypothetical protein